MRFGRMAALAVFSLLVLNFVAAVPGIPHQFYGYVTINGVPADGANIVAKITGVERASTASINGNYGFSPNIFYVPDPDSTFAGKTIEFFLNGTKVANYTFENGATTKLNLYIGAAPVCGDAICNAGETCSSCVADCGSCSVCGDGTCDAEEDCSSCTSDCGECPSFCGDATCDADETTASCPADCPAQGPFCGDAACNGSETCSTCAQDCGQCQGGGGSLGGGGGGGGGGSPALAVKIEGKCVDGEIVVTVLNTVGNPAKDATVKVVKGNKVVAEEITGEDGKASFAFSEEGDYTFYVTKNLYTQSSKTISVKECGEGEEEEGVGTGEEAGGAVNLCADVDCDDGNPCTAEFCVAATGHCSYENQEDGTVCSNTGRCEKGVCTEPKPEEQPGGPTGFFGLNAGQAAGAGLIIIALIALLAYFGAAGKRKKKK